MKSILNNIKIAVIIATKNRPELLRKRSLHSVLQQSKTPDYLVVVDDSSEKYEKENKDIVNVLTIPNCHITYLQNQRHSGASGAWNTAIDYLSDRCENFTSLFLAILDDDDEWHHNYLELCLAEVTTKQCNMVTAGFFRIEDDKKPIECLPPPLINQDLFLKGNPNIQGSNLFLSLELMLMAGSFDTNIHSCTDRDLCIRLCELSALRYQHIDIPLLNHFADSNRQRLSTPNSPDKNQGLTAFWQKYNSRMNDVQRDAFIQRAQKLFHWTPEKSSKDMINQDNCENKQGSLKKSQNQKDRWAMAEPTKIPEPFPLVIGVITGDFHKLLPLIDSITELGEYPLLSHITIIILCNGCSEDDRKKIIALSQRVLVKIQVITETTQIKDAQCGLFGKNLMLRSQGQVGIGHARSMLQKYVGIFCEANPHNIAWILDDDMRVDARAKQFLAWLPSFKEQNIDVVIGQYEGASPNPPLNGLRGQLLDLLHTLYWLDTLPSEMSLPDRSEENNVLRAKYPDYYYDLSWKHCGHLEVPFWLEPAFEDETVAQARSRILNNAPLLITGFPLTRGIVPPSFYNPLLAIKDSVNRGGNTFILNIKALTQTPNLIFNVDGREARRSDMFWAIFNKYHHGLTIKSAPFPVFHSGRVDAEILFDIMKVKDEIMGSTLYAGLQSFLSRNPKHTLNFSPSDVTAIWQATQSARKHRLLRLKQSFYRIRGLAQALSYFTELTELCAYLNNTFTTITFDRLESEVMQMNEQHISEFLNTMISQSTAFAVGTSHQTGEEYAL